MKLETLILYLQDYRTRHGPDVEVDVCITEKGSSVSRVLTDVVYSAADKRICLISRPQGAYGKVRIGEELQK